jgi:hypothetical protein
MIEIALGIVAVYALIGVLFAVPFVVFGVGQVDSAAIGAPIGFRLMILPGTIALWPIMARQWRTASKMAKH